MSKFIIGAAVLGLAFAGTANAAPKLSAGIYASTGQVASNNGAATCSAVGLTTGAANNSVLTYPGSGKGLTIYVPGAGLLQLCSGFPSVPKKGLDGFKATASCAIYSINGNAPAESVNFSFTSTVTDASSGVGTTTISIPLTSPIGAGCTATVNTTIVRAGK